MPELVMLDLGPGPRFVEAIAQAWDRGDAVFPLDQRLPTSAASDVVAQAQPTMVVDGDSGPRRLDGGRPVESGDAIVVATSGTTGAPKAVIHTHASVEASAHATSAGIDADPRTDTWLACLPPAHIGGLAVITRALVTGCGLIVHSHFEPEAAMAAVDDGATLVSLVTRALTRIDASRFRKILLGGAAPPADRPANAIATWGMTETGSGCVYDGHPLRGVEFRSNPEGEIEVRGPMLLRAYRTVDGERDPLSADGWFATGDLGHVRPDGRLWVDGRKGDVIVTGGEKVWPTPVEAILAQMDGVREVAIVGVPHPEWGHEVVAAIVAAGDRHPSLDAIRDRVRAELPAWCAPRRLEVVPSLPRTALGKLRRSKVAATFAP